MGVASRPTFTTFTSGIINGSVDEKSSANSTSKKNSWEPEKSVILLT